MPHLRAPAPPAPGRPGSTRRRPTPCTPTPPPTTGSPTSLYTTSADGSRAGDSFELAYRVYRPDKGKDDKGGVPLPGITLNLPGGTSVAVPQCSLPGVPPNGLNEAVANTSVPWPTGLP